MWIRLKAPPCPLYRPARPAHHRLEENLPAANLLRQSNPQTNKQPVKIMKPINDPKSKIKSQKLEPLPAITSLENLDAQICEIVRLRAARAARVAELEARVAAVQQEYAKPLADLDHQLLARENAVRVYCHAHRAELFPAKKSRETLTAVIGFELTPHRVETAGRKVTWKLVVGSLLGLDWGPAYVRQPEPQLNKDALLADRDKFTPAQLDAAGIRFAQDEQFYIRSKN